MNEITSNSSKRRTTSNRLWARFGGGAFVALLLVAVVALAGAAAADDVLLKNGETFEGVVATVTETHVIVRLEIGEVRLRRSQVAQIIERESPLDEYTRRRAELLELDEGVSSATSRAQSWFELAQWARDQELRDSYRESILRAGGLDPLLPGLEDEMIRLGRMLVDGRWQSESTVMRARGFVFADGRWMSGDDYQTYSERLASETVASRRAAIERRLEEVEKELDQERRLARLEAEVRTSRDEVPDNEVLMAQIELLRDVVEEREEPEQQPTQLPGFWLPGAPLGGYGGAIIAPPRVRVDPQTWNLLSTRQPGSFIDLGSYRQQYRADGQP